MCLWAMTGFLIVDFFHITDLKLHSFLYSSSSNFVGWSWKYVGLKDTALDWFKSYFSSRTFSVVAGDAPSSSSIPKPIQGMPLIQFTKLFETALHVSDAPCLILWFKHCNLKSMNYPYLYITCSTGWAKTIDLCYCSIKDVYKSVALPLLFIWP